MGQNPTSSYFEHYQDGNYWPNQVSNITKDFANIPYGSSLPDLQPDYPTIGPAKTDYSYPPTETEETTNLESLKGMAKTTRGVYVDRALDLVMEKLPYTGHIAKGISNANSAAEDQNQAAIDLTLDVVNTAVKGAIWFLKEHKISIPSLPYGGVYLGAIGAFLEAQPTASHEVDDIPDYQSKYFRQHHR